MKLFTQEQNDFLIQNYHKLGPVLCSEKLNLTLQQIRSRAGKLKLRLDEEIRKRIRSKASLGIKRNHKINSEQFFNIQSPEVAYFLGFMWADGNLRIRGHQYAIVIECVSSDMDILIPIFDKLGTWGKYNRQREGRKPQSIIITNNKPLVKFLQEYDYQSKSIASACKILSKIPEDLQHYWFRGLVDGDGCFYKPKKSIAQLDFSISSNYDQDWAYMENLCKKLGINSYKIIRRILNEKKQYKCSEFKMVKINELDKLCYYIYNGYPNDRIGLFRKYEKWENSLKIRGLSNPSIVTPA
jgi:intein-encoded DNA endonuclease-like protein